MLHRIISVLNLLLALLVIALVLAYASIVIPISLACFAALLLVLWLFAHVVDGVFIVSRWINKKFRSHS
ncbi:hypothetical protein B9J07_27695 [Sinorhizobium sp. LM21]|uniref:hypothetical protein n=1 Tax=Sinorhizobium sp. LM21 TaxID=1449788 RepID=UPI0005D92044|nr:hypothetical protein [Sinorhizobium sp. LM21]AJW30220.1 hypothetical protein pLM21S1_p102 [Sinorhizobium sp. LM21]OWZ90375.1 hypothetical protein B9J07_27695 [Sinorhizobium sp. LM21]